MEKEINMEVSLGYDNYSSMGFIKLELPHNIYAVHFEEPEDVVDLFKQKGIQMLEHGPSELLDIMNYAWKHGLKFWSSISQI